MTAHVVPWAVVAAALPADARRDARWIFHIGHVGSTLVARLLGELAGRAGGARAAHSARLSPMLPPEQRGTVAGPLQALLSRTFAADQMALVKATSFVSEIAPELVPPGGRALLLVRDARATISPASSPAKIRARNCACSPTPARQRMAARGCRRLRTPRNDAELAAAAWACEMTALEAAADAIGRSVSGSTSTRCSATWPPRLRGIADFFGLRRDARGNCEAICAGPLMRPLLEGARI